jgi:hypothetical protein
VATVRCIVQQPVKGNTPQPVHHRRLTTMTTTKTCSPLHQQMARCADLQATCKADLPAANAASAASALQPATD